LFNPAITKTNGISRQCVVVRNYEKAKVDNALKRYWPTTRQSRVVVKYPNGSWKRLLKYNIHVSHGFRICLRQRTFANSSVAMLYSSLVLIGRIVDSRPRDISHERKEKRTRGVRRSRPSGERRKCRGRLNESVGADDDVIYQRDATAAEHEQRRLYTTTT